jgi:membrane protease YdiL (CAAX protease family)
VPAAALWLALCVGVGVVGAWHGLGSRAFAATLALFGLLSGTAILFAARGVSERLTRQSDIAPGTLLCVAIFVACVAYSAFAGTFDLARMGVLALLVFLPLVLALSAERAPAGAWQDYLILAGMLGVAKFMPAAWLWPYPGMRTVHALMTLFVLSVALGCFLLARGISGTGYNFAWGPRWWLYVLGSFVLFACIAIPLGQALHFIRFAPQAAVWGQLPSTTAAVFFLVAWPEEFAFRGLLQNFLSKSSKSDAVGWWTASMIFGASHITNGGFPNWRYAILAALAGLSYGWTWKKTGSIFASAIVHTLVDVLWHFLFRTI